MSANRRLRVCAPTTSQPLLHGHEVGVGQFDGAAAPLPHLFQQVEPVVEVEVGVVGRAEVIRLLGGEKLAGRAQMAL